MAGMYLAGKGWGNSEIWTAAGGFVISLAPLTWSLIRHTKVGTLLAADALPEVAGVIMKPTDEGTTLAQSAPSKTVTVAGSQTAAVIAK